MNDEFKVTVDALRWVVGNTPAVTALEGLVAYVDGLVAERDAAVAAAAAANTALAKARSEADALASRLRAVAEDLADGVLDNPVDVPESGVPA